MTAADEDPVEKRAHEIWEREGRPVGQDIQHWERAEAEIEGENAVTANAEPQAWDVDTAGKSSGGRRKRSDWTKHGTALESSERGLP